MQLGSVDGEKEVIWARVVDLRMVRTSHETYCVLHQANITVMPPVAQGVPNATGREECHSRRASVRRFKEKEAFALPPLPLSLNV